MTIKAVLFDLDETLMMEEASVEAAFLATCEDAHERYGIDPRALTQAVRHYARQLWDALPTADYCQATGMSSREGLSAAFHGDDPNLKSLRSITPDYRQEAWSRALADHGVHDPAFALHLAANFMMERRKRHVLFSDAVPTLQKLQEIYHLALITNGPPDLQREKIQATGLAPYFQVILISGEIGIGKPDPRIFQRALDALQVAPAEAVMVGDNLERDIAGAKRVGISAIWMNRLRGQDPKTVKPDVEMTQLINLSQTLQLL